MRLTALTPCFRAEAGAAGRDTRGISASINFAKSSWFRSRRPETGKDEHERMLACAEEVLRRLDLHYRVMTLCAGDMVFRHRRPTTSRSGCRARARAVLQGNLQLLAVRRFPGPAHGSALSRKRRQAALRAHAEWLRHAVGRALIAVMETYQQEDGSIAVPDVLQPYMAGSRSSPRSIGCAGINCAQSAVPVLPARQLPVSSFGWRRAPQERTPAMALHRDIYWVGRQWAVTGYGMQAVDQKLQGKFDIEASRLWTMAFREA